MKLLSKIINKDKKLTFEIKENWDDFYLNIHNTPFAYLEKLNKTEIKKRLGYTLILPLKDKPKKEKATK